MLHWDAWIKLVEASSWKRKQTLSKYSKFKTHPLARTLWSCFCKIDQIHLHFMLLMSRSDSLILTSSTIIGFLSQKYPLFFLWLSLRTCVRSPQVFHFSFSYTDFSSFHLWISRSAFLYPFYASSFKVALLFL